MEFRYLQNGNKVDIDVVDYCKKYLSDNRSAEIHIGTDSQNHRKFSAYVIAIAFRNENHGAHVIYTSFHIPKIRDKFSRLWKEAEYSISVADILRKNEIPIKYIELDFNKKKNTGSNMMIAPSVGYVLGMGYSAITKPDDLVACKAADHILRQ